ncbi:MAG: ribbon-helix-helix protein, CopG family [Chloroflexi bacterium]|nr:ribbon-helix-helix protein, CopG family [Chloroflexota bacterium]
MSAEKQKTDHESFEAGKELVEVERRTPSGTVVAVRLPAEDADRLLRIAEATGKTVTQVAREAIVEYVRSAELAASPVA